MAEKKKTLEQAFTELDELLSEMENPEISLEESFKKYKKGLELVKYCNSSVSKIEQELEMLENDM